MRIAGVVISGLLVLTGVVIAAVACLIDAVMPHFGHAAFLIGGGSYRPHEWSVSIIPTLCIAVLSIAFGVYGCWRFGLREEPPQRF